MYEMLAVTSSVFRVMMFHHRGKIITIDPLTYYEKKTLPAPNSVLAFISSSYEWITTYTELILGQFQSETLLGTFSRDPPMIEDIYPTIGASLCMVTSSNTP